MKPQDDFLGDVYASKFANQQFIFIPICIEAGTHNKPLPGLRLPFVNEKKEVIGKGGYGEVTKEVIAYRQFSYKNESRSLNEVCLLPNNFLAQYHRHNAHSVVGRTPSCL